MKLNVVSPPKLTSLFIIYNMDIFAFSNFFSPEIFSYVILPLLIFIFRVFDQTIGILRIIFATKGMKYLVLVAGFFESLVWLIAVSQIINHLDNIMCYISFAAGFSMGNFLGIYVEKKLSLGNVIIRVVFQVDSSESIEILKENGFRLTILNAMGMDGEVKMLFATVKRKQIANFIKLLTANNPGAFYTVEDVSMVKEGYFHK
jgi:uncharacterized protein YebE (UPF0316 family)